MAEQFLDQNQARARGLKLAREAVPQPVRSNHLPQPSAPAQRAKQRADASRSHPPTAIVAIEVDQQAIAAGRLLDSGALEQIAVQAEHQQIVSRDNPRIDALRRPAVEIFATENMQMRPRLSAADLVRRLGQVHI